MMGLSGWFQLITHDYIDIDFTLWLTRLLTPLLVTFLLPVVIGLLLYMTAVILYVYKWHTDKLVEAYESHFWDGALKSVAAIWDAHGWVWHGYEIRGIEKIPDDRSALLIYYHGAIPVDLYYFLSRVYLIKNRLIHTVADRFLFRMPGFSVISEALHVIPGTVQTCSSVLKENNLLGISPGGVYEAQFSDNSYKLLWRKRSGFARVALEAKVPIIPVFTRNVREAFRCVSFGRKLFLKLYSLTRFPCAPIYGGFPVKLVTIVGDPIPYDENLSPDELASKVMDSLQHLIKTHQPIPGNIFRALLERF